jgi:hypothetical protein
MTSRADLDRPAEAFGLTDILMAVYARHQGNRDGALASHIPELARVEADSFGIAIATVGGARARSPCVESCMTRRAAGLLI